MMLAVDIWRDKLEFLRSQSPSPDDRVSFANQKAIEECESKIAELEVESPVQEPPSQVEIPP